MTRPPTHRELPVLPIRCGTCRHCIVVQYKGDSLCFHGDMITVGPPEPMAQTGVIAHSVAIGVNRYIETMDGEEYSEVWGGRVVDPESEVCDQWQRRETA